MEIELKLGLYPEHIARIKNAPLFRKIKPQQHRLQSIYFDSNTFQLEHRGIALRIRRVGKQWIQTVKAESQSGGSLTHRPEWETTVKKGGHPDFSVLPAEALELLKDIDLKQIAPIFVTEFKRSTWTLKDGDNEAEIALDVGKITVNHLQRDICEVEFELKSGSAEFLFDLAGQLLQHAPLFIESRSKAERGYLLAGVGNSKPVKAIPVKFDSNNSISDVYCLIIRNALTQLLGNIPGYFEHIEDPEYLHQIRVALRRIRTGVSLIQTIGQPIPSWNKALRKLMQTLNEARDWDVLEQEVLPDILGKMAPLSEEPIDQATSKSIQTEAITVRKLTQKKLHKTEFTELILAIEHHLLTVSSKVQEPVLEQNVRQWGAKILEDCWQLLHQCCQGLTAQTTAERHRARIAAKKMRYATDTLFSAFDIRNAKRFIEMLANLQDELGYTNDRRVAQQLLQQLAKTNKSIAFDLGRITYALQIETQQQEKKPSEAWRSLSRMKLFWR